MDKINKELSICRTCLTRTGPTKCRILTPETSYDGKLILKVLKFCVPEVHIDWNLESSAICNKCLQRLNSLYNFKNMCLKNDLKYHKKYLKKPDLKRCLHSVPSVPCDITSNETTGNNNAGSTAKNNVHSDAVTDVNQNGITKTPSVNDYTIAEKKVKRTILSYKKHFTNQDCFGCQNHIRDGKYHSYGPRHTDNDYICFNCGKHVDNIKDMRKHVYTHIYLHECKICKKRWRDLYHLDLHLRSHTKQKPFQCPECGKRFVQSYNLHQHLAIHNSGDQSNKNRCGLCGKILSTKYNLKIHLTTHNVGYKPRCPMCEKWFYTEAAMIKHSKKCVTVKEENEIFISEPEFIKTEVPEYVEREWPEGMDVKLEAPENLKEENHSEDDVFVEETSSQGSAKYQ